MIRIQQQRQENEEEGTVRTWTTEVTDWLKQLWLEMNSESGEELVGGWQFVTTMTATSIFWMVFYMMMFESTTNPIAVFLESLGWFTIYGLSVVYSVIGMIVLVSAVHLTRLLHHWTFGKQWEPDPLKRTSLEVTVIIVLMLPPAWLFVTYGVLTVLVEVQGLLVGMLWTLTAAGPVAFYLKKIG